MKLLAVSTGCQQRAGPRHNIIDNCGHYSSVAVTIWCASSHHK